MVAMLQLDWRMQKYKLGDVCVCVCVCVCACPLLHLILCDPMDCSPL